MKKNTYITYDKLLSLVNDYFRMTGGEDFLSKGTLEFVINLSIQDVINYTGYTFMSEFEVLESSETIINGKYKVFHLEHPIETIHEILEDGKGESLEIVGRFPEEGSKQVFYKKGTNVIYTSSSINYISVHYTKAYEYQVLGNNEHRDKLLPLPFTYIPVLIKFIYDNASIFTFYQGDGVNVDYFGHAQSRLSVLIPQDKLSDNVKIEIKE